MVVQKKEIRCPKCHHKWLTKSNLIYITCPSCQYKIKTMRKGDGDDKV